MEVATLRAKHAALAPVLTERSRRVWAATEAQAIGYGGTALVARATGIATSTIQRGLRELTADEPLAGGRTRRSGGRPQARDRSRTRRCCAIWMRLVEPTAPGDPDSPLRWTWPERTDVGGGARTVWATASATRWSPSCCTDWATACRATPRLVRAASMSIGTRSFGTIARRVRRAQRQQQPTISVDTKKKELVGAFKNAGPHLAPGEDAAAGTGPRLRDPGHRHHGAGRPFRMASTICNRNEGRVSVGIDHDTASFAVRSIQRWWQHMGRPAYRQGPVAVDHGGCRRGATGRASGCGSGNCSVWPIGRAW